MPIGSLVHIVWGISFEESWKLQNGDTITVNGDRRIIRHKEDSVVYVDPFNTLDGSIVIT